MAGDELEPVEVDEVGQLSIGVPGEQRALEGLAAPVPMLDEGWTVAAGYSHADRLLALLGQRTLDGREG